MKMEGVQPLEGAWKWFNALNVEGVQPHEDGTGSTPLLCKGLNPLKVKWDQPIQPSCRKQQRHSSLVVFTNNIHRYNTILLN